MGKHKGPSCKQCRREGERLLLKGERCQSSKCALASRKGPPGMHGATMQKKPSDYAIRLREKQKLRRIYGISEKQLRSYFDRARKTPGVTGTLLLQLLETRLDNIVYRLGLAASRKQARQMVKHSHFKINDKRVNLPSYRVQPKDIIAFKPSSEKAFEAVVAKTKEVSYPAWISFNTESKQGSVISVPQREEIDYPIAEQLIVEYYAR